MIGIRGTGSALGSQVVTNEELCKTVPVTPDWIVQKTGIIQRVRAVEGETVSTLALAAAQKAVEQADMPLEDVAITIVCTFTHEYLFPAAAMRLHRDLGLKGGYAFDLQANCSSPVFALVAAANHLMMNPDGKHHALVVGSEVMSPYVDQSDSDTAVFLADGAGAVVLGPSVRGLISAANWTDTSDYESVRCVRNKLGEWPTMEMYGLATGKQALKHLPRTVQEALRKAHWKAEEVDCYIWHQANLRLIEFLMDKFGVPMERTFANVGEIGNTGAASIPIALDGARREGRISRGDKVVIAGVGAGFGFAASCWEF